MNIQLPLSAPSQLSLLDDAPLSLLQDAEGGMVYHPGRVPAHKAAQWFDSLLADMPWRGLRRPMYERMVDVPRLVCGLDLRDPDLSPLLRAALSVVQALSPAPFTHVGLNLYRDERDSVAPHGDRVSELVPGWPIALLSLGAARPMRIRAQSGGPGRQVLLEPGSVLLMSHASQRTHEHGIPKCSQAVGPRISLAFRVRP